MDIKVKVRSFISKEKYEYLLDFFQKESEFVSKDYQEIYYFDSKENLRIQRNNFFSKVWMKGGDIHDEHREEIEIKFDRNDFERLEKLFLGLGLNIQVKWFRTRHTFKWQEINVMVDYTREYGYIIKLEKMSNEKDKKTTLELLKQKLQSLDIPLTSKEEFDKKYQHYKENWRKLIL